MIVYISLIISLFVNILLGWYVLGLLRKFFFISQAMSDLFLITRAFQIFTKSMLTMNSYNGEPIIEELVHRVKEVNDEMESFRDVFEYTLDIELEEELNDTENDIEKDPQEAI